MHWLRHIGSNVLARSKHRALGASVSSKGVTCRTVPPPKGKEKAENTVMSGYPRDVTFIPSLERLVSPSRISGSAGLGSIKVKTRGMQKARQRRHNPKTMISARTRNGKKLDREDTINLQDSLMVNRRGRMVGMESHTGRWCSECFSYTCLSRYLWIYCLTSHTDQTEEELASHCPLEVIAQMSINKTPFQRIF
jgi:hypothetical protein